MVKQYYLINEYNHNREFFFDNSSALIFKFIPLGLLNQITVAISGVASPNLMPGQRVGSLIYPQRLV